MMLFQDCRRIVALIGSDLRHEWILSICMVLALAAVFSPLFILLGLQKGITGNMVDRLKRDPYSCMVTPKFPSAAFLDEEWLKELENKARVVIASPTSHLLMNIEDLKDPVNAHPTAERDSLLVEHGIHLSDARPPLSVAMPLVVLSERLSQRIGKIQGDTVRLTLVRDTGKEEKHPRNFYVAGVLPKTVTEELRIWLPDVLFNGIYAWRRGHAMPRLDLPAAQSIRLRPEYDGVIVLAANASEDEMEKLMRSRKMSFSQIPEVTRETGWRVGHYNARLWKPVGSRVYPEDITALVYRYAEQGWAVDAVIPFFEHLPVLVTFDKEKLGPFSDNEPENREDQAQKMAGVPDQQIFSLAALPQLSEVLADQRNISPELEKAADLLKTEACEQAKLPCAWISSYDISHFSGTCTNATLSFDVPAPSSPGNAESVRGQDTVAMQVLLCSSPHVEPGHIALPGNLAGQMNAAQRQGGRYNAQTGEFTYLETGTRYFRAYAESIDHLEDLVVFVRNEGKRLVNNALREPNSRLAAVYNIQRLTGYMEQLYLLIVVISGISSFFAIAANVYAGVQRRRHDLAYFQLLGLHPVALILFPFLKSLVLVSASIFCALLAYLAFDVFASGLVDHGSAASLTRLTLKNILALGAGIFISAAFASFLAAMTVKRIDPGEYIRE